MPCFLATAATFVPGASVSASTAAFSASVHFRRRSTRVITSTLSIDPPSGLQKDSPGRADFREDRRQRNAVEAERLLWRLRLFMWCHHGHDHVIWEVYLSVVGL